MPPGIVNLWGWETAMRIEAGKWYLNREGNCSGPMQRNPYGGAHHWKDGDDRYYYLDGRAGIGLGPEHDLVKEWINPNAPQIGRTSTPRHDSASSPIQPQRASVDTYHELIRVLKDAHAQASSGKGKERHANGRPFDRQPIMELGRMFGPGFAAGQAAKKAQEAMGMISRQNNDAAVAELLGAINYLAACVMLVRERQV